jgi:hypothetical protein
MVMEAFELSPVRVPITAPFRSRDLRTALAKTELGFSGRTGGGGIALECDSVRS